MKKLSEILLERCTIEVQTPALHPTPALVLFGDVLDPDKVINSPEIEKLAGYFFANSNLSVVQVEDPEKVHDWLREEQYKTDVQGRAMLYPVQTPFEELTLDTQGDLFAGPAYALLFTPDGATHNVLTITCLWNDGLFRNDNYVIGAIIDSLDLEQVL